MSLCGIICFYNINFPAIFERYEFSLYSRILYILFIFFIYYIYNLIYLQTYTFVYEY